MTLTVIGRDCTGRREECGSRRGAAPHCPLRQPSSPTWRLPGTPVSLGTLNVPPELHLHYRRLKFLLYQGSWRRWQTGLRDHHRGVTSPHTSGGGGTQESERLERPTERPADSSSSESSAHRATARPNSAAGLQSCDAGNETSPCPSCSGQRTLPFFCSRCWRGAHRVDKHYYPSSVSLKI